jgi:outer membrane protein TolC
LILGAQSRPSYLAAYELLANRNAKVEKALAADDITLATAAPDRVALHAARTALNALDQRQLSLTHQLHALLGLAPEVTLPLSATIDLPPFDPAAVRAEISSLPDRRPDLVALRMGYAQADEQVHEAILAQFPDLVLGAVASGDNARVVNGGPNVSVGLPIFDRNQGAVAVAAARREQLHAEYASRLASVVGQVEAMLTEMEQLSGQLENAKRDLPAARLAADRARVAFAAANLDERTYVDLVVNGFTQEQNIMTLELALLDRQIALQTLTGAGLPTVSTSSDNTMSTQR